MTVNTTVPLALYNANLKFALRINKLLRENGQRWLALGASGAESAVDEVRRKLAPQRRRLECSDESAG